MDVHPSSNVGAKRVTWAKAFIVALLALTATLIVIRLFIM